MPMRETKLRSAAKALSWRVAATVTTMTIIFGVTGKYDLALLVGGVEAIAKLFVYFIHERIWNQLSFGIKPPPEKEQPEPIKKAS